MNDGVYPKIVFTKREVKSRLLSVSQAPSRLYKTVENVRGWQTETSQIDGIGERMSVAEQSFHTSQFFAQKARLKEQEKAKNRAKPSIIKEAALACKKSHQTALILKTMVTRPPTTTIGCKNESGVEKSRETKRPLSATLIGRQVNKLSRVERRDSSAPTERTKTRIDWSVYKDTFLDNFPTQRSKRIRLHQQCSHESKKRTPFSLLSESKFSYLIRNGIIFDKQCCDAINNCKMRLWLTKKEGKFRSLYNEIESKLVGESALKASQKGTKNALFKRN